MGEGEKTGKEKKCIWCVKAFMLGVLELTFRKQKLYSAQVALAGSYHEQGPALLVTDVYISTMLQQQLCNLIKKTSTHKQI